MKKGFILLSLALLSTTNIFAQRKMTATRIASNNIDMRQATTKTYLPQLPKGLRVDVKITSVANMTVQETSNPADMFVFRVYETRLLPPTNDPNSFNVQMCQLTEVFGFQAVSRERLTVGVNGDLTYNFSLTGLREGVSYGVDIFPVNNRVAATSYYQLGKSGVTSNLNCNSLSVVSGKPIVVMFYPYAPPK